MDKVDRSVSRSQGCRRIDWPLLSAFFASFPPAFLVNFPIFLKSGKSWDFRLSNRFPITPPENQTSRILTTQITVWVKTIEFTGLLFREDRLGPSYSSGPKRPQIGTFQTVRAVHKITDQYENSMMIREYTTMSSGDPVRHGSVDTPPPPGGGGGGGGGGVLRQRRPVGIRNRQDCEQPAGTEPQRPEDDCVLRTAY